MGDSNARGLSPNTLSTCPEGVCWADARERLRRSADGTSIVGNTWISSDRDELLPGLLPA